MTIDENGVIKITSGDTVSVPFLFKDINTGLPLDLTDIDIYMTVKDKRGDMILDFNSLVGGSIVKANQITNTGVANLNLLRSDTYNLVGPFDYDIELRKTTQQGSGVLTAIRSYIEIAKDFVDSTCHNN